MSSRKYKYYCPETPYGLNGLDDLGLQSVLEIKDADFILLSGGADISSHLYGEDPTPNGARYPIHRRDAVEIHAIGVGRSLGIPVFGICRGAQLLHVMNGGKLIQHLETHHNHTHKMKRADTKAEICEVNSLHHQGIPIDEAINMYGAKNVAINDDEVSVEAFVDEKRQVYGVQYHPEFGGCSTEGRKFFKDLITKYVGEPA